MHTVLKTTALVLALATLTTTAFANDCGWDDLTPAEQSTLTQGKSVMRTSTDADGVKSHIDQWAFSGNKSLTETVSNFYDMGEYKGAGGVADIVLSSGSVATDNPAQYDVTPRPDNPFKTLYTPFRMATSVKVDGTGYNIVVNYLSSPGLIRHVYNDVCFAKVGGAVLVRFLSTITDSDNPMLARDGKVFGWDTRKMLWNKVFSEDVQRASQAGTKTRVENLKQALLGSFGK